MARSLSGQEVRVSVAIAVLEQAEASADRAATHAALAARGLAAAGGVRIPRPPQGPAADVAPVHPAVVEAEQIVRVRAAEIARKARRRRRPTIRVESAVVGALCFAAFVAIGSLIAVGGGRMEVDAVSRVVSAQSVVAGRDPHLEAVGFVWGPFPTVFEVPLALFRSWWPALTANGLAAVIVSAAFMAGTLVQLLAWGRDVGAPRWTRLAAVAFTAAHPLVWLYGANGMSEACGLFFLVLGARHLARWLEQDDVRPLAMAGIALGLAYLARYETVAAMAAAATVVVVVSWHRGRRSERSTRERAMEVTVDFAVLVLPAVAAVVGWALVSWVIIGEPFAQFTSEYGNSAIRAAGRSVDVLIGDLSTPGRAWFFLRQVLTAAPFVGIVALWAVWLGDRAAARATAVLAVVGGPLLLQFLFAVRGDTFPWYRYVLSAVVLCALLALVVAGALGGRSGRTVGRVIVVAALLPGAVLSFGAMTRGDLGSVDDQLLLKAASGAVRGEPIPARNSNIATAARVAAAIDRRRGVVPGAVLTDVASTYWVLAAAPRPEVYIIPPDRDFEPVVADPATFGVRYLLLHSPRAPGDALLRQYPGLWTDDGAPIATLVESWGDEKDRAGAYRLYAVEDPAARTRATPEDGFTP
jgi:hypothetical protein